MKLPQQGIVLFLTSCLLIMGARDGYAYQSDEPPSQSPPQAAQQSSEQLQQLVAPIALYPDALVAQILSAATFPDEIVEAGKWMEQHKDLTGDSLAKEVDKQSWDVSVKALTQFSAVLANMNRNLAWTSELGDVYVNQQGEVTQAIQTMRQRAKQAGNLETTPQQTVKTHGKSIVIEPAETDVVYVPQYDPWLAYGAPLAVFPGWYSYPGLYLGGPGMIFGAGFGVGPFGGFGWGWGGWGFDWRRGGRVVYNHNTYVSRSRTIINHNTYRSTGGGLNRSNGFHGGGQNRSDGAHGFATQHSPAGTHSGAFSGFGHGGVAHDNSSRGRSSFGGFNGGGGGFHGGGGGFHGGGGGFHGGGGGGSHGGGGHR